MGTYVTQSAFSVGDKAKAVSSTRPPLRQFFMMGKFSLAGPLTTALTKQVLRFAEVCPDPVKRNVRKSITLTVGCVWSRHERIPLEILWLLRFKMFRRFLFCTYAYQVLIIKKTNGFYFVESSKDYCWVFV